MTEDLNPILKTKLLYRNIQHIVMERVEKSVFFPPQVAGLAHSVTLLIKI